MSSFERGMLCTCLVHMCIELLQWFAVAIWFHCVLQRLEIQAPVGHGQEKNVQHPHGEGRKERLVFQGSHLHPILHELLVSAHWDRSWVRDASVNTIS